MLYRIALALGLLALGVFVGRELARTKPVRAQFRQLRLAHSTRLMTPRVSKVSVH